MFRDYYDHLYNAKKIDKTTAFYKNCKRQRKCKAKICAVCPFRTLMEDADNVE